MDLTDRRGLPGRLVLMARWDRWGQKAHLVQKGRMGRLALMAPTAPLDHWDPKARSARWDRMAQMALPVRLDRLGRTAPKNLMISASRKRSTARATLRRHWL